VSLSPLVPYLHVPDFVLLPKGTFGNFPPADFSLKPFGTLVAIGVYLGAWLAIKQGRRLGLDERKLMSFIVWVVGVGFVGGHVLDTVFYFPERLAKDPLSLVRLWEGLSSFGGFVGALIGFLLWRWRYQEPALPYADTVASAFPVGWVFGRAGCTLAHDHPGVMSNAWFAVRYPEGGRFDLGLYEMVLTLPLAIAFLYLRKKPRPWGFYLAVMSIAYAPSRFALDFLRIREGATADARYLALTPAQWACFGLLAMGVVLLWRTLDEQDFSIPVDEPEPAPADG
jgi:phosphatidylglycerol---prolipoprotein diacylglyceryl transferase